MQRLITKKLQLWKSGQNRKPLIVDGVRQVGKTYTILDFGKQFRSCHYFNFEKDPSLKTVFFQNLDPHRIIQELSLINGESIDHKHDLVFFDEIQECPQAIKSLKYFCEDLSGLAVCSAGSLLGVKLSSESFPVGKVEMLKLRPLSFKEFLLANKEDKITELMGNNISNFPISLHEKMWGLLKSYFIVGGLPEVVNTYIQEIQQKPGGDFNKIRQVQDSLYRGYLADISKHSGKINSMHLERILHSIPGQLSKEQDKSTAKFKFKGVVPKIKEYSRLVNAIDWLQKSGLIIKVPIANQGHIPFSAYCKENFFKLFMFDIGMLGAIAGIPPISILQYNYGTYKGYFAENFVLQEFLTKERHAPYSWQEGTSQVEFLLEHKGEVIPVEVKSGNITKAKSLRVFTDKYAPSYRLKITGKPFSISNDGNTKNIPLYLAGEYFNNY